MAAFLFTVWLGGFTFYSLVVVPTGHQVLRSKVRQGLISQQVTNKLNGLGAVTFALLLWDMAATRRDPRSRPQLRIAAISWTIMVATLATLVWLHPRLDAMLAPGSQSVTDIDGFYSIHRCYLIVAMVQWGAALVHFGVLMAKTTPVATGDGKSS